jgi:holo-[acyl-carrier protein] synthase
MIFGTGVDIVAISRFERFLREGNEALIRRLFTEGEIAYCAARRLSAQHYALRFAAKEAYVKALGTGLREGMSWQQMEVVNDHYGKPDLLLSGRAAELFRENGLSNCFLTLSHDADVAIAFVVLERA